MTTEPTEGFSKSLQANGLLDAEDQRKQWIFAQKCVAASRRPPSSNPSEPADITSGIPLDTLRAWLRETFDAAGRG